MKMPETMLDPFEIRITQLPPEELVAELAKGEMTARAVTNAFLRRAALAQRVVRTLSTTLGMPLP